jgi:hypothetical protein
MTFDEAVKNIEHEERQLAAEFLLRDLDEPRDGD